MSDRNRHAWRMMCAVLLVTSSWGANRALGADPPAAKPQSPAVEAESGERKRVSSADLEETLLVIGELDERMRLAETKLGRSALDRKRQIGKLRGLIGVSDQQIRLLSARVQRLDEKCRQMRQELVDGRGPDEGQPKSDAAVTAIIHRAEAPLRESRAQLERLCQQRTALQQRLQLTQDAHLEELLNGGNSAPAAGATGADALETVLGLELKANAAGGATPKRGG